MTMTELNNALQKIPTALESDCKYYSSEWVLVRKEYVSKQRRYLSVRERTYIHDFSIENRNFCIKLVLCNGRDYSPSYFDILKYDPKRNEKDKLFHWHIIKNTDCVFLKLKEIFCKEISIDEFLDYFNVDRKIFEKEQQ